MSVVISMEDAKNGPPGAGGDCADSVEKRVAYLLEDGLVEEACALIMDRYGPEIRGYLRGTMGSDTDGDDLYQDVCAGLWKGLPRFEGRSSIRTWLYVIAHRLVAKRLARYSRSHVVRLNTTAAGRIPDQADSLLSQISDREHRRVAAHLMSKLTAEEREVVILRAERGLSFSEVAEVLEISEAAARKRYQRAEASLKIMVEGFQP